MKGQVADKFGGLIEQIWSESTAASTSRFYGSYSNAVTPREFKQMIGRFAPSFAGYGQQDTQELIAFLLDGLHEDLNRIQKKPYIEKPDWKDGGNAEDLALFAKECWDGYKKRNDSVIVDLFQGQLKSTLICPDCSKVSRFSKSVMFPDKFNTYTSLSSTEIHYSGSGMC
jgi:ubiquitin carboxyl-terminal hydrolase 4/11/15